MGRKIYDSHSINNPRDYFISDEEAKRVLKAEGRKLKYCALRVWRQYLDSYKPHVYARHLTGVYGVRTKRSLKSIKLGDVKKVGKNEWQIQVTYLNDLAYHESVISKNEPKGHAIMLISYGWKVKKGSHRDIERFGEYKGFNYLEKVRKMYEGMKDRRVNFEIQWKGNDNYTK